MNKLTAYLAEEKQTKRSGYLMDTCLSAQDTKVFLSGTIVRMRIVLVKNRETTITIYLCSTKTNLY
jgi:hypothetical protein